MPFVGQGLHFLIALFFAVHALRTGRQMYWLIILFSFPLLGSVAYFFAEYIPASKLNHGVKQVSNIAINLIDPTRELREARHAFDLTPTVQNRMRLAVALDGVGEYSEAVKQFDACLDGPFANDLEVCFGAAKAKFHNKQPHLAIELLQKIRNKQDAFRSEELSLLLAESYAESKDKLSARIEFEHANNMFGSAEVRARYALWAASINDFATAKSLRADLQNDAQHWNKHSCSLYKSLLNSIDEALSKQNNP
jgi:hypothetical protein